MNHDDAMLRQVLSNITSELAQGREYMQSIAHEVSVVSGMCARIEESVKAQSVRLEDLREDHDKTVVSIGATDVLVMKRIVSIESKAAAIRNWSAGALAVVTFMSGAIVWLVANL